MKASDQTLPLQNGETLDILFRSHPRARRLKLRYDSVRRAAVVTLPPGVSEKSGLDFARRNSDWLQEQQKAFAGQEFLSPDNFISFLGHDHLILHQPDDAGRVRREDGRIIVGGPAGGFEVRLLNWLKKQARIRLEQAVEEKTGLLGVTCHKIRIGDPGSRWGSCSSRKTLSFSWRLIMTPATVFDYVVAHEVAHLREMNHSPAFWREVDRLVDHATISRRWLRQHGPQLMALQICGKSPAD
ncbi:SprT family zinc-dependent metalloprotease [Emcibacter sp.]|uniref:M48 family metallopeptidase n=1 Tax=Emcibacter sp. TaxID=1979954 RepID=UPI002AA73CF2|nr:SprT family zinc-dependent metalloprotease [Emcibacter sp.]